MNQYGARSPSPKQKKKNSWTEDVEESTTNAGKLPGNMPQPSTKKQISQSVIMTGQHDRGRKDVPKVKVHTLLTNPIEKRYKKIDEKDIVFLNFLGIVTTGK